MQSPEPFRVFTRKLEDLGLTYMVTGSVAAIYYGEPRLTNDVDLVVVLTEPDAARLETAFPDDAFYRPPREVIEMELAREQRGHFNLIDHATGFKADVYLAGKDELHRWALERVQTVRLGSDTLRMAPPEYVIARKLQFFREGRSEKHLRDIRSMLAGLGDAWPKDDLLNLISRLDLKSEWDEL